MTAVVLIRCSSLGGKSGQCGTHTVVFCRPSFAVCESTVGSFRDLGGVFGDGIDFFAVAVEETS